MATQTTAQLVAKKCLPCEGGVPPCTPQGQGPAKQPPRLASDARWPADPQGLDGEELHGRHGFFNQCAELAEAEGHHPDLHLEGYRQVWIEIWTHAIGGLSENDFILAAKIDGLPVELSKK